jgi:hypothetical protein
MNTATPENVKRLPGIVSIFNLIALAMITLMLTSPAMHAQTGTGNRNAESCLSPQDSSGIGTLTLESKDSAPVEFSTKTMRSVRPAEESNAASEKRKKPVRLPNQKICWFPLNRAFYS